RSHHGRTSDRHAGADLGPPGLRRPLQIVSISSGPAVARTRMTESHRRALALAALSAPFAVFLIVYAPAVGHGFISDDFRWIVESRIAQPTDLVRTFSRNIGFYRPIIALTFAADYAAFGSEPFGYGVTNLTLASGCAVLLFMLIRALRLPAEAAGFGAALWLLHFHG